MLISHSPCSTIPEVAARPPFDDSLSMPGVRHFAGCGPRPPRTTEHYDRARGNLDRHGVHFLTAYVAGV